MKIALAALLLVAGAWQAGQGAWIQVKAWLAQVLIRQAWSRTVSSTWACVLTSSPVVVDDGVSGGPVQPSGRVVDPLECTRGDAAHDHILRDVGRQLTVINAGGHEGLQPIERVDPAAGQLFTVLVGTHHIDIHLSLPLC